MNYYSVIVLPVRRLLVSRLSYHITFGHAALSFPLYLS